jgi:hypothetical protein
MKGRFDYLLRTTAKAGLLNEFASSNELKANIRQMLNGMTGTDTVASDHDATAFTKLMAIISMKPDLTADELQAMLMNIYDSSAGRPLYDDMVKGIKTVLGSNPK